MDADDLYGDIIEKFPLPPKDLEIVDVKLSSDQKSPKNIKKD